MFAFFILYQWWVNEYMQILNVAFLRRRRHLRRIRVAPYTWTISRPAESWFDIHRRFCTARYDNSSSFFIYRLCAWFKTCDLTHAQFLPTSRASLLSSSSWRSAHRLTRALFSSCGHFSYFFCLFCQTFSWPGAGRAIALTYHTCRNIGPIKQNSAGSRLRSKICPANVGWKRRKSWLGNDPGA